jgi:putative FmdB family regulatory protein
MPTYVYECTKCGDEFEQWQSFSDDPLKKHPGCGGKVSKVLQPVGIVFKGSGFHKTDSRTGSKRAGGSSDNGDGHREKDTPTSDTTTDAKADSKADSKKSQKSDKPEKKADPKKADKTPAASSS